MSRESPPHGPLVPVERPNARASTGASLASVLWGLSGVLVGVVLGAAVVGGDVLQRLPGDSGRGRELNEISERLGELRRDLTARERELGAERQERKEAIAALKEKLEATEWASLAATLKGEFLGRLLAHEQARSDATRRQLVDTICGLGNNSKSARMAIARGPMELSSDEIRRGAAPELDRLLVDLGVNPDHLAQARRSPSDIPAVTAFNVIEVQRAAQRRRIAMRDVNEAVAAVQRHVQNIRQAKAVTFSGGMEYAIPQDAARLMLSRNDCQSG